MTIPQWFAENTFRAIRTHDSCATKKDAFCEKYERRQVEILKTEFDKCEDGTICHAHQPYQLAGREHDLFVHAQNLKKLFSEVKAMYKTFFLEHGRPYWSYLYSPFKHPSKENSAGFDLAKLVTCPPSDTSFVAQVLLGSSHAKDDMASDLDEYARLAMIDCEPWLSFRSFWENPFFPEYYYDIRVWVCAWDDIDKWWPHVKDIFAPWGYSRV